MHTAAASQHEKWLEQLGAVGDDEAIYEVCRGYIRKLVEIENLLAGKGG